MTNSLPVMKREASEARSTIASAISSGSARRPTSILVMSAHPRCSMSSSGGGHRWPREGGRSVPVGSSEGDCHPPARGCDAGGPRCTSHHHDDVPPLVPRVYVAVSVDHLLEPVAAIDHRPELPALGEGRQKAQVLHAPARHASDDLLPCRERHPRCPQHFGKRAEDHEQPSALGERPFAAGEGCCAGRVDDNVVAFAAPSEVLFRVVDQLLGPDGSHQLEVGNAAHASHACPEVPGELDRGGPHSAGSTDDQYLLSTVELCLPEEAQCGGPAEGQGRGLLVGKVGG